MPESRDPPVGVEVQVLVGRAQGATQIGLTRVLVRPGGRTRAVSHWLTEEVWCVLQGRACFHRQAPGGQAPQAAELKAGDAVFVPPGYLCWIENTGAEDFVFFCGGSPPWQDTQDVTLWDTEKSQTGAGAADPAPTPPQGEHTMTDRFEYKILVSDADDETDEETLNGLGDQGWELVNAVADVRANEEGEGGGDDDQNVPVTVFYFKRRKEQA